MLDALNSLCLTIMDPVLGWLLHLPRDVALLIIALLTALVLTVVRLFTTNQDLLKRCKADKLRLKGLIAQAKSDGDKEAVVRHRKTVGQIGMKTLVAEGKPLLASIVPIALIAVWAFGRIAYLPPDGAQPVTVKAYFPVSGIGETAHIVPPKSGWRPESRWIQQVVEDEDRPEGEPVQNGIAVWRFHCRKRDTPYTVRIRYQGKTFEKELLVDGTRYADPLAFYEKDDDVECVELAMPEYKLLGFVPGIGFLLLQPWIVGYLVIVLPLSFLLKPVLRIY